MNTSWITMWEKINSVFVIVLLQGAKKLTITLINTELSFTAVKTDAHQSQFCFMVTSLGGLESKIIATSPPFNFYISPSDTWGNILFLRTSPSLISINRLSIQIDALPLLHNIHDSFTYKTECNAVSSWHQKTSQYSCAAFPQAHLILRSSSTPWNKKNI